MTRAGCSSTAAFVDTRRQIFRPRLRRAWTSRPNRIPSHRPTPPPKMANRRRNETAISCRPRMKYPLTIVLVGSLLASCSRPTAQTETAAPQAASAPATPATYPLLVIDEQHQLSGSNPPPAYQ